MTNPDQKPDQKSYSVAMQELKEIVDRLRQPKQDVDVDVLLGDVKTAKELIKLCQEKLGHADIEIKNVLKEIEVTREEEGEVSEETPAPEPYKAPFQTPVSDRQEEDIPF
jgi:exodeoxyribonuclease VII small subunit